MVPTQPGMDDAAATASSSSNADVDRLYEALQAKVAEVEMLRALLATSGELTPRHSTTVCDAPVMMHDEIKKKAHGVGAYPYSPVCGEFLGPGFA